MSDSDAERAPGDLAANAVEPAASAEVLRAENARLKVEIASAQGERDRLSALIDSMDEEVWFADPQKFVCCALALVGPKVPIRPDDAGRQRHRVAIPTPACHANAVV
jgi:hypothetical protein